MLGEFQIRENILKDRSGVGNVSSLKAFRSFLKMPVEDENVRLAILIIGKNIENELVSVKTLTN